MTHDLKRKLQAHLVLVLLTLLIAWFVNAQGWLNRIELAVFDDRLTEIRHEVSLPDDIKVVLIDEYSLQKLAPTLGQYPWPRTVYAELIDFFTLLGVRAIAFDILFTEPTYDAYADTSHLPDHDERFASATAEAGNVIHAALMLADSEQGEAQSSDGPKLVIPNVLELNSLPLEQFAAWSNRPVLPIPPILSGARSIGLVGLEPDSDGVYRQGNLFWLYDEDFFPSFSLAALLTAEERELSLSETGELVLGEQSLPVNQGGRVLINVYGDYRPYSIASLFQAYDLISQGRLDLLSFDPFEFEDSIVLIGASAVGLEDVKPMSNSSKAPGVYIHAAMLGNFLDGGLLFTNATLPLWGQVFGLTAFSVLILLNIPSFLAKTTALALLPIAWFLVTGWSLQNNLVLNVTLPTFSMLMTWGFGFSYLTVVEGASKRRVKKMLSQYVSETMLNEVLIAPEDVLHAGVGRKEKLTVLFSDIRSFTVISESLPAEQVVTLLNTYFKEMTDTIFKHQGTLDKFIGDAIMAFWGAPIRVDNDAIKAVTTAIEMISRLDLVNEKLALEELPTIEIGVGVNTGEVILGNIGSDRKLDYTVIGDPVNTASRLEGITKQYGVPIVISESTKLELSDEFVCILLDHVRVKGKRTISPIYYPVLRSSEELSELESLAQHAFDLYRQQQWQQALTVYRKLPWSQFVAVYEQRIAHFLQNPPGKDWDGIYTFQTK